MTIFDMLNSICESWKCIWHRIRAFQHRFRWFVIKPLVWWLLIFYIFVIIHKHFKNQMTISVSIVDALPSNTRIYSSQCGSHFYTYLNIYAYCICPSQPRLRNTGKRYSVNEDELHRWKSFSSKHHIDTKVNDTAVSKFRHLNRSHHSI